MYVDNHGAFALANDPVGRFLNKHVRTEHHFTQELTTDGVIVPVECDTSDNVADIGTKALGPIIFAKHAAKLVGPALNPPTDARATINMLRIVVPTATVIDGSTQTTDPFECICAGTFSNRCGRPVPKCVSTMRPVIARPALEVRAEVRQVSQEPEAKENVPVGQPPAVEARLPRFIHSSVTPVDLYRGVLRHFQGCDLVSSSMQHQLLSRNSSRGLQEPELSQIAVNAMRASFVSNLADMTPRSRFEEVSVAPVQVRRQSRNHGPARFSVRLNPGRAANSGL